MTALTKYQRIESVGLWRASPQDQRREVVVSIGDATLIISDMNDRAVAHWSLAAVERANPGQRPAIFFPFGDGGETLELAASEGQMIDAIEKLRRAVDRARPKPGRLRWAGLSVSLATVALVAIFWLPGAVTSHAVSILPQVKRVEIDTRLVAQMEALSGRACQEQPGLRALSKLRARVGSGPMTILRSGIDSSLMLPGGRLVFYRGLVEDYEEPDVIAGFAIAEMTRANEKDPLLDLLEYVGIWSTFRLLTTGEIQASDLRDYAEHLMRTERAPVTSEDLLIGFSAAGLRSSPYAFAIDVTGETVLNLIEADPLSGQPARLVLSDADWLRLQSICGS